ncbi:MAG: hypothetical protein IJV33_02605 [Bacteroidaceae bacterium]|nr:hypothetical protein [Bacteroidaceae bacterium]
MYSLDLPRLNLRSPYYVWEVKEDTYAFDTDYGVAYEIKLGVNTEVLQYEVCAFDINNKNGHPSPGDKNLRDTIIAIIEEFFLSNNGVFLYICATENGLQAQRFRLFVRWFNTYENKAQYVFRTVEGVMDEDVPNYGAIIVQRENPDLDLILKRFDEIVQILQK